MGGTRRNGFYGGIAGTKKGLVAMVKVLAILCIVLSVILVGCSDVSGVTNVSQTTILPNPPTVASELQSKATATPTPSQSPVNTTNHGVADEENTRYISNILHKVRSFETLHDLETESVLVVAGTCVSSEPVFQNETLYRLSKIKPTKVYKGEEVQGETINVVEMGGRTTFGEYEKGTNMPYKSFEQGADRLPHDYNLVIGDDGYVPLQENDEVLLFLESAEGFIKDAEIEQYGVIGVCDGKLYLQEDGTYLRPVSGETDKLVFTQQSLRIAEDEAENLFQTND